MSGLEKNFIRWHDTHTLQQTDIYLEKWHSFEIFPIKKPVNELFPMILSDVHQTKLYAKVKVGLKYMIILFIKEFYSV